MDSPPRRAPSPRRSRSRSPPRGPRDFRERNPDERDRRDREAPPASYRDRRDRDQDRHRDRGGYGRDERDSRPRDSDRGRDRARDVEGQNQREREREQRRPPRSGGFRWKDSRRDDGDSRGRNDNNRPPPRADRGGPRSDRPPPASERTRSPGRDAKPKSSSDGGSSSRKERKPAAAPRSGEPMIVVNINDRLGTKAAIPCFASDRIKEFKILVAARVGREPHEILLKRQGERPFKDQLTLQDYGVSNGVQLDLEVDTGD